jgi:hypothetical protein
MFFMAYSSQPTVAVDTNYRSGDARLDEEKGRRALRRRPRPATAGSGAGSVAFHSAFIRSTEHLVDAIARGYEVTVLRYKSTRLRFNPRFSRHRYPAKLLGRADEVIE